MITEDYVSFELAKLLKDKGFDWECDTRQYYPENPVDECDPNGVYAPTLQTTMKWLREVHNIYLDVRITNHSITELFDTIRYYWVVYNAKTAKYIYESTRVNLKDLTTYEEATEDGIKYALENLI